MQKWIRFAGAGAAAGAVSGLSGAGGGMVLVPLLEGSVEEDRLFLAAPAVMAPICLTALVTSGAALPWMEALPYLLGSLLGGILSRKLSLSVIWLHRILGLLILVGGLRLLWS